MSDRTCAVEGCSKDRYQRQKMCGSHFMKQYRYGDPHYKTPPRHADLAGQRFGLLVAVEFEAGKWRCVCDCGEQTAVRSGDLNRGTIQSCGRSEHRRRDDIGYGAAHGRVRTDRGPIEAQSCTDCGSPAQHWSYNHDDPDERYDETMSHRPVAYSSDPSRYSPRCVSCHKRFDLQRTDAAAV